MTDSTLLLLLTPTHLSISEPISSMKTPKSSITVFSNSSLSSQFGVSSYRKARMNDLSMQWRGGDGEEDWRGIEKNKWLCKKKFVIRPGRSACNFDSQFDTVIKWNTTCSQTKQNPNFLRVLPSCYSHWPIKPCYHVSNIGSGGIILYKFTSPLMLYQKKFYIHRANASQETVSIISKPLSVLPDIV